MKASARAHILQCVLVLGIAGGILAPAGRPRADDPKKDLPAQINLRNVNVVRKSTRPFITPESRHSGNKGLDTTLVVKYAKNRLGDHWIQMRSYEGRLAGPTLRVRPGDKLSILLVNDLPPETGVGEHSNEPHGFNHTNLHTHGLHVSPEGFSDNVFLDIKPGGTVRYNIQIPEDHPCGTFWYHAHRHGSVAVQLSSGMAGMLIVEGGKVGNLDQVKEIKAAEEKLFVFQQIPYRFNTQMVGEIVPSDVYKSSLPDGVNQETTINGVPAPVFVVQTGTVQRWRMLHAGLGETLTLALVRDDPDKEEPLDKMARIPLYEIAADGLATGKMAERGTKDDNKLELQPGYRSDVLVHFDKPGDYLLVSEETPQARSIRRVKQEPKYLAKVIVRGPDAGMNLPDPKDLAPYAPFKSITKAEIGKRTRNVSFKVAGKTFTVNGKPFDPNRTDDFKLELDTAEEWIISSEADFHPFHIHVNPFEVILKEDKEGNVLESVWRDTVVVSDFLGPVKIRMRFKVHTGKSVLHCHNLRHEDRGMMAAIKIVPKGKALGPAQAPAGFPALPAPAPAWALADAGGKQHRLAELAGRNCLVVLFRGTSCAHCMAQLRDLAGRKADLDRAGLTVVAICPDDLATLREFQKAGGPQSRLPFPVLADPALDVFRSFGCGGSDSLHGSFLIDGAGRVRWQHVADAPLRDVDRVLATLATFRSEPQSDGSR